MSERKVVAAVDSSVAGNPVLVTARALARVLGARVEAVHVKGDDDHPPRAAAAAVGVPLRVVTGPVVERLVEVGRAEDTAAMVIGARSTPTSPHALGSTALAVLGSATKPVVVVPPVGRIAARITRVLVLHDDSSESLGPLSPIEPAASTSLQVVGLHVGADDAAADEEIVRRYVPSGIESFQVERRSGELAELVPAVADELECNLIALAWAPEAAASRKVVVHSALERSQLPIMLVPARLVEEQQTVSVQ